MTTWREAVREELHRYSEETGEQLLTLDAFYRFSEQRLATQFPENNHVQDKMRQQLQNLRDNGELTFLDNEGRYRIETLQRD